MFDFKTGQEIYKSLKKDFKRTLIIIAIGLGLCLLYAFGTGYLLECGKQKAIKQVQPSEQQNGGQKSDSIVQKTEGDQSPAVVSDEVTINYDSPKSD